MKKPLALVLFLSLCPIVHASPPQTDVQDTTPFWIGMTAVFQNDIAPRPILPPVAIDMPNMAQYKADEEQITERCLVDLSFATVRYQRKSLLHRIFHRAPKPTEFCAPYLR